MGHLDRHTVEVYEDRAAEWSAARGPRHLDDVAWLQVERVGRAPVVDLGCGPGWHLEPLGRPAIGLDAARAILQLAQRRSHGPLVQASVADLPFASGTLGGAVASRVHTHLPAVDNPRALADLHRCLTADAPVVFDFIMNTDHDADPRIWAVDDRSSGPFDGRLISRWTDSGLADLLEGAGFAVETAENWKPGMRRLRARRRLSLPDTVGADMSVLICGLNPSVHAAEAGVGFVTASNRFWPGAQAAGLVTVDRDPFAALSDGVGMTDLVKRASRRASELDRREYRAGLARVERLVSWLRPRLVCFVGLSGWRAAVDTKATAGLQARDLAGAAVYVMPSTSGLNTHCRLSDVVEHLTEVKRLSRHGP